MRKAVGAIVAVGLMLTAAAATFIASAPELSATEIDAVFVHAGGTGERLQRGLEIWDGAGETTLLILSLAESPAEISGWCSGDDPSILCESPDPVTTFGEAVMLDEIADRLAIDRIAVVTSDYHLRRATMIDTRCTTIEIVPISAGNEVGVLTLIGKYVHEFGGLIAMPFSMCRP